MLEALVIVAVGVLLAFVARQVLAIMLGRSNFNAVCERAGIVSLMREGNIRRTPSQFAGIVLFYAIIVLALLAALVPLGVSVLGNTLGDIALYAPRVLLAVLILVLGTAAGALLSQLTVQGLSELGVRRTGALGVVVRYGIVFIAAVLAGAMVGIDTTILVVVVVIALGAVGLTASLAFGLGLRGLSENVAASRYVSEGLSEGDEISINGVSGRVVRIGYALTTVRGADGHEYLIPNSHFTQHVVEKLGR